MQRRLHESTVHVKHVQAQLYNSHVQRFTRNKMHSVHNVFMGATFLAPRLKYDWHITSLV